MLAEGAHSITVEVEEVIGQSLELLMPPEYHEQHREGFQRYLSSGQARQ